MLQAIDRDKILTELVEFHSSLANDWTYPEWKRYVKRLHALLPDDRDLVAEGDGPGVDSLYRLLEDVDDLEKQPDAAETLARDHDGLAAGILKLSPWLQRLIRDFAPPSLPEAADSPEQSAPQHPAKGNAIPVTERPDRRFRLLGALFNVAFEGEVGNLPANLVGVQYVYRLLEQPNRTIKASELRGTIQATDNAMADQKQSVEALRKLHGRLQEIGHEMDSAKDGHDFTQQDLLEKEKEQLLEDVRRRTGKGGHARLERPDRKDVEAVRRAVRLVVDHCKLKWNLPKLSKHLDRAIKVGTEVVYRPDPSAPQWIF